MVALYSDRVAAHPLLYGMLVGLVICVILELNVKADQNFVGNPPTSQHCQDLSPSPSPFPLSPLSLSLSLSLSPPPRSPSLPLSLPLSPSLSPPRYLSLSLSLLPPGAGV